MYRLLRAFWGARSGDLRFELPDETGGQGTERDACDEQPSREAERRQKTAEQDRHGREDVHEEEERTVVRRFAGSVAAKVGFGAFVRPMVTCAARIQERHDEGHPAEGEGEPDRGEQPAGVSSPSHAGSIAPAEISGAAIDNCG